MKQQFEQQSMQTQVLNQFTFTEEQLTSLPCVALQIELQRNLSRN